MAAYEEMLRGIQGLFAVTGDFRRNDFANYVESLQLGADFAGLQAIELARLTPRGQADTVVEQVRRQGEPDYHIWPDSQRDALAPIVQIEPAMGRNLQALGFDPFSEPPRRLAMEQARDSGLTALSGKVKLVFENEPSAPAGFLLALPIFKTGAPHGNLAARRANTIGWVMAVFRMGDLMASLYGEGTAGIVTEIFDGTNPSRETRLFPVSDSASLASRHEFAASEFVVIAGHTWMVRVYGTPGFKEQFDKDKSDLILMAGLGLAILLTLVSWQMATARERAQHIAERMTRELKESEECWKFALEGAGDGVWDWHLAIGELRYSERWKEILGPDSEEHSTGLDRWTSRIHPDDLPAERQNLRACLAGTAPIYLSEHRIRWTDGSWHWVSARGMVVSRDIHGAPLRMIGTISDISERRSTEEQIRHMAQHDPLTNLPNRTLFSDRLHLALSHAKRNHEHAALMFVDLDNFKPINDRYGHDVGDIVLKEVSLRMRQSVRDSDTVARIGGDEFIILLPSITSHDDAFFVAEKVRLAIAQNYDLPGHRLEVSSSIGIAIFPEDGIDALTLSKNADDAMYQAKQSGRNRVQFFRGTVFSQAPSTVD